MKIPNGQYRLLYCDPPWKYEMYGKDGYEKSPDKHYDCMSNEELLSLRDDVLFATQPNSVMFMWAVWPKLPFALELMKTWGFTFKTGGAWHKKTKHDKTGFGTGYIVRSACEPWLIGTYGDAEILNRSTRNIIEDENIIEAKIREHSRKPDCTYEIIEKLFPGPYLELFARNTRDGWESCGNEINKFDRFDKIYTKPVDDQTAIGNTTFTINGA